MQGRPHLDIECWFCPRPITTFPAFWLQAPTCSDQVKNGNEADVDCGESCTTTCANTKKCTTHYDCTSEFCRRGTCQVRLSVYECLRCCMLASQPVCSRYPLICNVWPMVILAPTDFLLCLLTAGLLHR